MNRPGHFGLALLVYSPIVLVLFVWGEPLLAILGLAITLGFSNAPDLDMQTPLVKHRGWTHTVYFATFLTLGVLAGSITAILYAPLPDQFLELLPPYTGPVLAFVTAVSIVSHYIGDIVTKEGLKLFDPVLPRGLGGFTVSETRYALGWFRASNGVMNGLVLLLGGAAFSGAIYLGSLITNGAMF